MRVNNPNYEKIENEKNWGAGVWFDPNGRGHGGEISTANTGVKRSSLVTPFVAHRIFHVFECNVK